MTIIDASDLIVGRLATKVAKKALLGDKIDIVNSEKAIISGKRKMVFAKFKNMAEKGTPAKGPFLPRMPDRFLRRSIKRMLPYKKPKGRDAFERIMCHIGVPDQFKDKKIESLDDAHVSRLQTLYYVTIKDICEFLGGKIR